MDDRQPQQIELLNEAQAAVKQAARSTTRRMLFSFVCVGMGGVSVFGLVDSLYTPNVRKAATSVEPVVKPEFPGRLAESQHPKLTRVPTAATSRHDSAGIRQTVHQFEPASDYPTTAEAHNHVIPRQADPAHPDWAQLLPPSDRSTNANNSTPAMREVIPRTADRTRTDFPSKPSVDFGSSGAGISFKFRSAPWVDVVRQFATRAGYKLRMETTPTGTFDLYDTHEYSPIEALDLINGYLIRNGNLLVRNGQTLTLISTRAGIPHHLVPAVSMRELDQFGRNEVVSVSMPAPRSTKDLAATLKPLLGQLGSVVAVPGTRQMLVTDTTAGIRRLRTVLANNSSTPVRYGRVYQLQNSAAPEIAKALSELFGGAKPATKSGRNEQAESRSTSTGRVIIVPESQTNTLLINAPTEMLPDIYDMIGQLDRAPQQVVIQALLVEVDLGNTDEFGVEIGVQDSVLFNRSVVDNLVTLTETVSDPSTGIQTTNQRIISQTAQPGFNFNGPDLGNNTAIDPSSVGGQALTNLGVGRVNGDLGFGGLVLSAGSEQINVLLRALQANYHTDVLSTPQVQTTNHHPGQIQIGQLVPVVEGVAITPLGSANPVIRQDKAGLILDVTPHIHADGSVLIDVMAEKSQFRTDQTNSPVLFFDATNGNAIRAPIKDVTNAKTQVSIKSGQTIVLGGMITKDLTSVERRVPILGSIPVLGHAFRYELDQTRRKELLIFLTPRIVTSEAEAEALKNETIGRHHFPLESAWDVYGPLSEQYNGLVTPNEPLIHPYPAVPVPNSESPVVPDPPRPGNLIQPKGVIGPRSTTIETSAKDPRARR